MLIEKQKKLWFTKLEAELSFYSLHRKYYKIVI